jgi:hypothetical protein
MGFVFVFFGVGELEINMNEGVEWEEVGWNRIEGEDMGMGLKGGLRGFVGEKMRITVRKFRRRQEEMMMVVFQAARLQVE